MVIPFLFVFLRVHRKLFTGSLIGDHAGTGEEIVRKGCFPVVDVSGDGDVPDVLRFVHQPFTLWTIFLRRPIYTHYRQRGQRVVFRRRRNSSSSRFERLNIQFG